MKPVLATLQIAYKEEEKNNLPFILKIASLYIIIKKLFLRIVKNNLEREKNQKRSLQLDTIQSEIKLQLPFLSFFLGRVFIVYKLAIARKKCEI